MRLKFPAGAALWLADQSWLHHISLVKWTTSAPPSQLFKDTVNFSFKGFKYLITQYVYSALNSCAIWAFESPEYAPISHNPRNCHHGSRCSIQLECRDGAASEDSNTSQQPEIDRGITTYLLNPDDYSLPYRPRSPPPFRDNRPNSVVHSTPRKHSVNILGLLSCISRLVFCEYCTALQSALYQR